MVDASKAETEHRLCGRIPGGNEQRQRQPEGGARGTEKLEPDLGNLTQRGLTKQRRLSGSGRDETARQGHEKKRNCALISKARAESEVGDLAGREAHAQGNTAPEKGKGGKAKPSHLKGRTNMQDVSSEEWLRKFNTQNKQNPCRKI